MIAEIAKESMQTRLWHLMNALGYEVPREQIIQALQRSSVEAGVVFPLIYNHCIEAGAYQEFMKYLTPLQ